MMQQKVHPSGEQRELDVNISWKLPVTEEVVLTHWGLDKMAAMFQTTFWKAFAWNENIWILIKISLKFVPIGLIDNKWELVQIVAWHRPGDKPLSEPMMVSLPMHMCVTRPQ